MSMSDTPGEGPWWHVYTAKWYGCILTVSRITYLPGWFPFPSLWFWSSWVSFPYGRTSLAAEAFL